MISIHADIFPEIVFIRTDWSDDYTNEIRSLLVRPDSGSVSIIRKNYLPFLKIVQKHFGNNVLVYESIFFDSQEPLSECMLTGQIICKKVVDIIESYENNINIENCNNNNNDQEEIYSTQALPKVHLWDEGTVSKIKFPFNQKIVQVIKEINGRKYLQVERNWSVPLERKCELIDKIKNLGFNIIYKRFE